MTLDSLPPLFSYAQARSAGLSKYRIYALRDSGTIESLGAGLYFRADREPADLDLLEIAVRSSDATMCLTSALARHGLVDEIPASVDIAVPRGRRAAPTRVPVRWHHFAADTFDIGREIIDLGHGVGIGVYTAERSIVDAFRLRGREGNDQALEALRAWLRSGQPSVLYRMAEQFPRALPSIRHALEVLL